MATDIGSQRDRICFSFNVDSSGLLTADDGVQLNLGTNTTGIAKEYGFVNQALKLMIEKKFGEETWNRISKVSIVNDVIPFMIGTLYDVTITDAILEETQNLTGVSRNDLLESFGLMFYDFCEFGGYNEVVSTLAANIVDFLRGLNTLTHHLTDRYPGCRLPLFQVIANHDDNTIKVCCHTVRNNMECVIVGLIKALAQRIHDTEVAVQIEQPDDPLPNRFQLKVYLPSHNNDCNITATLNHNVHVLNQESKINPTSLCQLFPFHIIFDSKMKIVQAGIAVVRVIKDIDNQMLSFRDIFQFVEPDIDCTYDEVVAHTQCVFIVRVRDKIRLSPRRSIGDQSAAAVGSPMQQSPLLGGRRFGHDSHDEEHKKRMRLKGQMLPLEDGEHIIFLCSANVNDLDELLERGLYLGDVPLHDATRDLILLNEQFRAENDLAHKLEQVTERLQQTYKDLETEKKLTDKLIYSILPPTVANKLRLNQPIEAVKYNCVTILFSGICDFDLFYSNNSPMKVVFLLNELYTRFDVIAQNRVADVYKVETVGDKYMLASGLPEKSDVHARNIASVALDMINAVQGIVVDQYSVKITIGIHSGEVVAGVVGHKLPHYAVFGSTVCVASRMESTSEAGKINISKDTYNSIQIDGAHDSSFCFQDRGLIRIKGLKAPIRCYFLSRKDSVKSDTD